MTALTWFMNHVAGSAIAGLICAGIVAAVTRRQHRQVRAHLAEQDKTLAELKGSRS